MSITHFAALFPDQCEWVHRFGTGHATIQSVWSAQQYESPPELCTMYACFAGSPTVQRFTSAWLQESETHIKSGLAGYRAAWGWNPIPAVLLPIVHNAILADKRSASSRIRVINIDCMFIASQSHSLQLRSKLQTIHTQTQARCIPSITVHHRTTRSATHVVIPRHGVGDDYQSAHFGDRTPREV